jgi:subtilase family serine protease
VNQGQGAAKGDVVVAVFNTDGTKLLAGATLPVFTLQPGRSIDVGTGYEITENQTLLLIVDPNGEIAETDDTNNRVTVAVSVGNPEATRSAVPFETPIDPADQTVKTPAP